MIIPLLVLALLQGLLEYLPVSSEGQILLVAANIYYFTPEFALSVIFWLHLGTAFTVIAFYRHDIFSSLAIQIWPRIEEKPTVENESRKLFGPLFVFVVAGTIGTMIAALPLYFLLRSLVTVLLGSFVTLLVGILLIVTGIILYFQPGVQGNLTLGDISLREAFVLGLLQGVAVLPGISRSGMTLTWLLVRGVRRDEALRLSLLLGVPAAFGVVTVDLIFGNVLLIVPLIPILLVLMVVAFITGLGALAVFRYYALKLPWWMFCLTLGIIVVALTVPLILIGGT
ncbi:MAG: undecaprenyl-diphosphate phosphatase [Promethearchaeota archaeon]